MSKAALTASLLSPVTSASLAHHDPGKITEGVPIVWQGTVAKVSWDGAHVMYRLNITDSHGAEKQWQLLGASPKRLMSRGISPQRVNVGETVTVGGYFNARRGVVSPVYLSLADGTKLFVGYFTDDREFSPR